MRVGHQLDGGGLPAETIHGISAILRPMSGYPEMLVRLVFWPMKRGAAGRLLDFLETY
jgi:hypothetical protein